MGSRSWNISNKPICSSSPWMTNGVGTATTTSLLICCANDCAKPLPPFHPPQWVEHPLGGTKVVPLDIKLIVATNCDLEERVESGRFRRDLYYRLSGMTFELPPLRQRKEDIPPLLAHFMKTHGLLGDEGHLSSELLHLYNLQQLLHHILISNTGGNLLNQSRVNIQFEYVLLDYLRSFFLVIQLIFQQTNRVYLIHQSYQLENKDIY